MLKRIKKIISNIIPNKNDSILPGGQRRSEIIAMQERAIKSGNAHIQPKPENKLKAPTKASEIKINNISKSSATDCGYKAPSGFEFPYFPFNDDTIVKIKDRTNYRSDFLGMWHKEERDSYDQTTFDHDLAPYMLEIEVEKFDVMFRPKTMNKLGKNKLPSGFADIYEETLDAVELGEEPVLYVQDTTTRKLLKEGLLTPYIPKREESDIKEYLEEMTVPELKEECGKLGLKKGKNKAGLIQDLLEHADKISFKPMGIPSQKFYNLIDELGTAYIEDVESQLADKPAAYAAAIWEEILDYAEQLPSTAKKQAEDNLSRIAHLFT